MTNDLERRIARHRAGNGSQFTAKYRIMRLVYYETTNDVRVAIAREKQLKSWRRSKKIGLIESKNPEWIDLAESKSCDFFPDADAPPCHSVRATG